MARTSKRGKRAAANRSRRSSPSLSLDFETLTAKQLDPDAAGPDDPGGRAEFFFASRVDRHGRIPRNLFVKASRIRRRIDRELLMEAGVDRAPPAPPGGPGSV